MPDPGHFYSFGGANTHLALAWKGEVRYIVPRNARAQNACWKLFQPGKIEPILRLKTSLPRMMGSVACGESDDLTWIRSLLPSGAGLSCARKGASGIWSKDTILLLDSEKLTPQIVVKAGKGSAVAKLLANEAEWLSRLGRDLYLQQHVPRLLGHGERSSGTVFLAQQVLEGDVDFELGQAHFDFLNALHAASHQATRFAESQFARTLRARLDDVEQLLPAEWSLRLRKALVAVEHLFGDSLIQTVTGHNDFTPWNVRIVSGRACVFDWEYAERESLPLLDALHFTLKPLALRVASPQEIAMKAADTIGRCREALTGERCYHPEAQTLAYYLSLCVLFIWADRGIQKLDPMLQAYGPLIDQMTT